MRKIAVFDLPFRGRDEFAPLAGNPAVDLAWVKPFDFERRYPQGADVVILPGSGKTIADLTYLKQHGGQRLIAGHLSRGGTVIGICGGLQCLGQSLYDPFLQQGHLTHTGGLGWLPIGTTFGAKMLKSRTQARSLLDGSCASGVEYRSGSSWQGAQSDDFGRLFQVTDRQLEAEAPVPATLPPGLTWAPGQEPADGWVSHDRKVWGTYLHLVFHNDSFCRLFFSSL